MLRSIHAESALTAAGITSGPLVQLLAPSWRWVFYVNVPIGIVALAFAWAASAGWETPRRRARIDLPGAAAFTIGLGAGLIGLTLIGSPSDSEAFGIPTSTLVAGLFVLSFVGLGLAVVDGLIRRDPFIDVRLFRDVEFSSAALVSLLTGYALATAIIGAAVFVDRVLYGGPPEQQVVLGALAAATAVGALASGFLVRRLSLRLVTLVGLGASAIALVAMAGWTPATSIAAASAAVAAFGLGFGLTVTPALDGGRRGGRSGRVRDGLGDRDRGQDGRDGGRAGRPDRVRLDDDRPAHRPDLRHAGRLPAIPAAGAGRSSVPRRARHRRPRALGIGRGSPDHGRAVPRRRGRRRSSPSSRRWRSAVGGRVCWRANGRSPRLPARPVETATTEGAGRSMAQTTRSRPSRSDDETRDDGLPLDRIAHRTRHSAVGKADGSIRVFSRVDGAVREAVGLDAIPTRIDPGGVVWIDANGPSPGQVAAITRALGLHELIAEDILEGNQRAKIEVTDDLIHIVLFALEYGDPIVPSEIDVVLGSGLPPHRP